MRLHVGCGLVHRPGWINLDRYAAEAADLLADAVLLPFSDGAAEAIEALQLIEHLGYVGTLYALYEWARVLASGGTLLVETPDRTATLQAATTEESREAALPWLFGMEQRGQGHRYLFSADELAQMAVDAGFEQVEIAHVAAQPAHPTLRLTARRAADTLAIRFAVRFHRALVTAGVVALSSVPPHLAALESVCKQMGNLVQTPSAEALIQLVSLAARYSPRVAACALQALPDSALWPTGELAQARQLSADLEQERFPARLACRWRALLKSPGDSGVAWAQMEREISLYLTARLYPGTELDPVRAVFDAVPPSPSDLAVDFFCREALTDLARRLTARGVRAFAQGDLAQAAQTFEAAIGYAPDLLWPRWNLARLLWRQKRQLDALTQYESLQANLPAGLRPAFEREMDARTGRSKDTSDPAVPLDDPAGLLEERV